MNITHAIAAAIGVGFISCFGASGGQDNETVANDIAELFSQEAVVYSLPYSYVITEQDSLIGQEVALLDFYQKLEALKQRLNYAQELNLEILEVGDEASLQLMRAEAIIAQLKAYLKGYQEDHKAQYGITDSALEKQVIDSIERLTTKFTMPARSEVELMNTLLMYVTKKPETFTYEELKAYEKALQDFEQHPLVQPDAYLCREINQHLEAIRKILGKGVAA